ncbi:Hypothetical_protein [Hexamita inflata]|uniref:Hypothetical_protein n=1 Tax=Hexamita inflata TaxID=28002 RepID=A0AA86QPL8_9EUKA|nr:Hypothetical protein HINF_LOCUS45697 [Hexamita inflata]
MLIYQQNNHFSSVSYSELTPAVIKLHFSKSWVSKSSLVTCLQQVTYLQLLSFSESHNKIDAIIINPPVIIRCKSCYDSQCISGCAPTIGIEFQSVRFKLQNLSFLILQEIQFAFSGQNIHYPHIILSGQLYISSATLQLPNFTRNSQQLRYHTCKLLRIKLSMSN